MEKISRTLPLGQLTHPCLGEDEWLELLKHGINLKYGCFKLWALLAPLAQVKKATRPVLHYIIYSTLESHGKIEAFIFPAMQSLRLATPLGSSSSTYDQYRWITSDSQ
jgi:hypothetical protein